MTNQLKVFLDSYLEAEGENGSLKLHREMKDKITEYAPDGNLVNIYADDLANELFSLQFKHWMAFVQKCEKAAIKDFLKFFLENEEKCGNPEIAKAIDVIAEDFGKVENLTYDYIQEKADELFHLKTFGGNK